MLIVIVTVSHVQRHDAPSPSSQPATLKLHEYR